jgi:tetratricopeptide (TPR) repeat protein
MKTDDPSDRKSARARAVAALSLARMADDKPAGWMATTAPLGRRAARHEDSPCGAVIGRFIVLEEVGRGAMGVVYAAYDPQLDRKVALKLLNADGRQAADLRARLLREAQTIASIDHPNVVTVHEAGTEGDDIYVAMEFAVGGTLRRWLQSPRTPAEITEMFLQAGRGLAAAHAAGLVHRDFKPDNVLVTGHGVPRVADFGLVGHVEGSEAEASQVRITSSGAIVGTPQYMAPELLANRAATEQSDQFAFCVALYDALYGRPPFAGDTVEELTRNVLAGELVVPATPSVPARLRSALTRGLAPTPEQRWPTMTALLAELEPDARRVVWPYAAAGIAVVIAGGALLLHSGPAPEACATLATDRARAVWTEPARHAIHDAFAATGRPFAARASDRVGDAFDGYRNRWVALATDVCEAERDAGRPVPALIVRRRACLDSRLDALRSLVATLSVAASPELVDEADSISHALPDLAGCGDAAPDVPQTAIAPLIASLEGELATARLHVVAGDYTRAVAETASIGERADAVAWPLLQVHVRTLVGRIQLERDQPASSALLGAAQLALTHGFAREATDALTLAIEAAGSEHTIDRITSLAALALGTARNTHDRALEVGVETATGKALVRSGHWQPGLAACRTALADASQLHDTSVRDSATDCLIEALTLLGQFTELEPLIDRRIADTIKTCGEDCPRLAEYLLVASVSARRQGNLADARRAVERSLAIRVKAFGDKHVKVADALNTLAEIAYAEGKPDEARGMNERALAMVDESDPRQVLTAMLIHLHLAMAAATAGRDHFAEATQHYERAVALARRRAGGDSLTLAIVLLNYGQLKADEDLAAGLAMLENARDILERHHDRRAMQALGAMLVVADHHDDFAAELRYGEQALASSDADTPPDQRAGIEWGIARALIATHGDRERARRLATEARARYLKLGPGYASAAAKVERWLAAH